MVFIHVTVMCRLHCKLAAVCENSCNNLLLLFDIPLEIEYIHAF